MILYTVIGMYMQSILFMDLISKYRFKIGKYRFKKGFFLYIITLLVLWALTAFRSPEIGTDTETYIRMFLHNADGVSVLNRTEIGWQVLNYLIYCISESPYFFIFAISTILYLLIGIYMYRYSENIIFSICLFYVGIFSYFTNILRQSLAMCIILFAYQAIRLSKNKKTIMLILLATIFHKTAIVAFLLFAKKILNVKKRYFVIIIISIIGLGISGALIKVLPAIIPYRYIGYFASKRVGTGYMAITFGLIKNICIYLFVEYLDKKKLYVNKVLLCVLKLSIIFNSLAYVMNLFSRVAIYFSIIVLFELSNILNKKYIKNCNWIIFAIVFSLMLEMLIILMFRPEWNHLYPYSTFLNNI